MTVTQFQIQLAADLELACLLEATARKPGNVHPLARFVDLEYADFVTSAEVASPILAQTNPETVGESIFGAVQATVSAVSRNTNLGIILLLAPLCATGRELSTESIGRVLDELTVDDSRHVYHAINLASAGGMGEVTDEDLADEPTLPLVKCMQLAADRDFIARQYTNRFYDIFSLANELSAEDFADDWERSVIRLQLKIMQRFPDTLIARKLGLAVAEQASRRADEVLQADWPQTESSRTLYLQFDNWLREDGHRRNPGTTADIIAAVLFVGLRNSLIEPICPEQLKAHAANLQQQSSMKSI